METVLKDIAKSIQERFGAELQDFRDQAILIVSPEKIVEVVRVLREEFGFNMLSDETAVITGRRKSRAFMSFTSCATLTAICS